MTNPNLEPGAFDPEKLMGESLNFYKQHQAEIEELLKSKDPIKKRIGENITNCLQQEEVHDADLFLRMSKLDLKKNPYASNLRADVGTWKVDPGDHEVDLPSFDLLRPDGYKGDDAGKLEGALSGQMLWSAKNRPVILEILREKILDESKEPPVIWTYFGGNDKQLDTVRAYLKSISAGKKPDEMALEELAPYLKKLLVEIGNLPTTHTENGLEPASAYKPFSKNQMEEAKTYYSQFNKKPESSSNS